MRRLIYSLIAAVVAAALLAGCGGSGSDEETSTISSKSSRDSASKTPSKTLTKAEFIKRSDAICQKTDQLQELGYQAYAKQHPGDQSSESWQNGLVKSVGLPPIQAEVEELAALGPPAGDEERIEDIVEGIEGAITETVKDPSSALKTAGNPFAQVGKLADEYGFKACNDPL